MHTTSTIRRAFALASTGLNTTQIASAIGVPRRTVSDWLRGRLPRSHLDQCERCGRAPHRLEDLPRSYVYLLGIYLGDGCISPHPRGVFRFRVSLDAAYPRIIAEVETAINAVMPRNQVCRVDYATWVELAAYSRSWPCLFPQHAAGRKHERAILLERWQLLLIERDPELLLRGLIHSDGCRSINTGRGGWSHPRYSFSNVSDDIRGIFVEACELLGLHTTRAPRTVYISRKADVARLDEFVGPKA